MAKVTGGTIIERPLEVVFDFVADDEMSRLQPGTASFREDDRRGHWGGDAFRATHKSGRHPVEMTIDITGFERPQRMASETTMSWSQIDGEIVFEPVGGSTRMRWAWDVRPQGLANLLRPLIGVVGRRCRSRVSIGWCSWGPGYRHYQGRQPYRRGEQPVSA